MRFHNICFRTANWSVRKWRYEPIKTGVLRSGGAFCTLPENVKKSGEKTQCFGGDGYGNSRQNANSGAFLFWVWGKFLKDAILIDERVEMACGGFGIVFIDDKRQGVWLGKDL